MTKVFNDPRDFREEMIDGYIAAYGRYLRRVPGASGVIASWRAGSRQGRA